MYGILKTYELEIYQRRTMHTNREKLENVTSALITNKPKLKSEEISEVDVEPESVVNTEKVEEEGFLYS